MISLHGESKLALTCGSTLAITARATQFMVGLQWEEKNLARQEE